MLALENTALVVVDVQGKLARIVQDPQALVENVGTLVRGMTVLEVPILWTEQYPQGLGPTVDELARILPGEPFAKRSFSCWGEPAFARALDQLGRNQVLLAGIETHVCVYQTAVDLLAAGYRVHVVSDAVSSRSPSNKAIGLQKIQDAGGELTSVEIALFELLKVAEGPRFKAIIEIVK